MFAECKRKLKTVAKGAWRLTSVIVLTYRYLLSITQFARHMYMPQNHTFFQVRVATASTSEAQLRLCVVIPIDRR